MSAPSTARPRCVTPRTSGAGSASATVSATPPAAGDRAPMLGRSAPHGSLERIRLVCPEPAHEVAGVDVDRARHTAHAVDRAGLHAVVVVVLLQIAEQFGVALLLGPRHVAADHDALPRREGDALARTGRLAVAAFDTAVDFLLDRRHPLQVVQVRIGVIGEDHSGVQDAVGVEQMLDLPHHVGEFVTVLASHERRHDASGAVLGLQDPCWESTRSTRSSVKRR